MAPAGPCGHDGSPASHLIVGDPLAGGRALDFVAASQQQHDRNVAATGQSGKSRASMRAEAAAVKWKTNEIAGFLIIHLIAALALLPWFFSWTGVAVFAAGIVVFRRPWHQPLLPSSPDPSWLLVPALGWSTALPSWRSARCRDSPPHWVAVHRRHHQFADEAQDPHSPLKSFFWAHMGWLLVKKVDNDAPRPDRALRQGYPARSALRLDRKAQQLDMDRAARVAGLLRGRVWFRPC